MTFAILHRGEFHPGSDKMPEQPRQNFPVSEKLLNLDMLFGQMNRLMIFLPVL